MSNVIEIDENNFETEVQKSDVPVMIDFWATWCGPCRMIAPHVEEASSVYSGKLKVGKVDVDNNHKIAMQYSIMSIPDRHVLQKRKRCRSDNRRRPQKGLFRSHRKDISVVIVDYQNPDIIKDVLAKRQDRLPWWAFRPNPTGPATRWPPTCSLRAIE